MKTLVNEIQRDVVGETLRLSTILRKAKMLAARLGNQDFSKWVDQELAGFPEEEELIPDYRIVSAESFGHFMGPRGEMRNAPIPTLHLSEEFQDYATRHFLPQGVRELETLIEMTTGGNLKIIWPANYVAMISQEIYTGMGCMQAWKIVSKGQLESILDTVRNRLLNFLLELEGLPYDIGEQIKEEDPKFNEKITQIFNTTIVGDHAVVASGHTVTQSINQQVTAGDLASLKNALRGVGIEEEDIEKLVSDLDEDGERTKDQGFGERVAEWIGTMTKKIVSGTWQVAIETGPAMLKEAIARYLGWK